MLLEGQEGTYSKAQGCWLSWCLPGRWLTTSGQQSLLMANTAASPSFSKPSSWRQGPLPSGADVCTQPGYTQSARSSSTALCPASGGHSTLQMSAPFGEVGVLKCLYKGWGLTSG